MIFDPVIAKIFPPTGIQLGSWGTQTLWGFPDVQLVKNLPAMQKTPVRFLGQEEPLEKEKATPLRCSGIENSMDCTVHGGHKKSDTAERISLSLFTQKLYK